MPLRILFRLLLLFVLAPGAARGDSAASVGVSEITGKDATALLQRPTASFRVYAFRETGAVPIPFQVDERNRRDYWAYDQGPEPVSDESPGVFDENDVVVFMNRDLGAKGDPAKLPRGATTWLEVRVGSQDAPLGYAYLGTFDSPPAILSDQPAYVRSDPVKDEVFADRYTVRFGAPLPTYLALVHQQGESPESILNGVRAYGEVWIFGGLVDFKRSEKDLEQYSTPGYRSGPVRVIRSAKYWIRLALGFNARGRVELLFYRDFVEARARVKIRIPPRLVAAGGYLRACFDFHDFTGGRVLGPDGLLAEPIGGQMTEDKRQFADRRVSWSALLLPSGQSVLLAVRLGGSLQRLDQKLYLDESIDPAGGNPSFGFKLEGINRLDTGEEDLSVKAMVVDSTAPSQITAAATTLLSPPEVAVTPVGKSLASTTTTD
jgi:hypothetical protein